jgi:hypothetical protein
VGGPVPPAVHEPAAAVRWLGKPGPAYPGFPAQGASAPLGGRAWPRALPRQREGGLPGEGSRNLRGVELRRKRPTAKATDPRGGEGTPRRDPGGPAGRSRPNGRVGGHQTATATAATAYLWRRGPAAQGQPRPSPGPHGARRPGGPPGRPRRNRGGSGGLWWPGRRGAWPLGLGARSPGREARSTKPGSAHRRPNPPAPPGRGPSFCPRLRKSALLCRGGAPTTKGCVPTKSAGAPTPAGPRVRVPRPTGDGAG